MMKGLGLAAMAIVAAEGVAYACSCLATDDPAQLRTLADESAKGAAALVEAKALTAYSSTTGGETMQVERTLAGTAPATFKVERGPSPSSASCDVLYEVGVTKKVIVYPTARTESGLPVMRTSGLCTDLLLSKPVFVDSLTARLSVPQRGPERG